MKLTPHGKGDPKGKERRHGSSSDCCGTSRSLKLWKGFFRIFGWRSPRTTALVHNNIGLYVFRLRESICIPATINGGLADAQALRILKTCHMVLNSILVGGEARVSGVRRDAANSRSAFAVGGKVEWSRYHRSTHLVSASCFESPRHIIFRAGGIVSGIVGGCCCPSLGRWFGSVGYRASSACRAREPLKFQTSVTSDLQPSSKPIHSHRSGAAAKKDPFFVGTLKTSTSCDPENHSCWLTGQS